MREAVHSCERILSDMGIIEVGTVIKLNDGTTAVVVEITDAELLGTFYTVMVSGGLREISESQIARIISRGTED